MEEVTAGIIIIGDEILKGHTKDTNSSFLLSRLWSLGVRVKRLSVISDDVEKIAQEVKNFSSQFHFVFTSGGIGPTHDDVTMSGISQAFDEELKKNEDMVGILEMLTGVQDLNKDDNNANDAILKMANLPKSANLQYGRDPDTDEPIPFPLISVRNVYIFPGIPEYLEKMFLSFEHIFRAKNVKFFLYKVYVSAEESDIASALDITDARFKDRVHLGSYPVVNEPNYKVKLTLESESEEELKEAYISLVDNLPDDTVVSAKKFSPNSRDVYQELISKPEKICNKFRSRSTSEHVMCIPEDLDYLLHQNTWINLACAVKSAWAIILGALDQYELNQICIAFNGGKDCTVLLDLWMAALKVRFNQLEERPMALYIKKGTTFKEAEDFIDNVKKKHNLNLITIKGDMKTALQSLKTLCPSIKACLLGTRRHDPHSATLRAYTPTDSNWPQMMRINPILDWSYQEVWGYLRTLKVPYCQMYDMGYTSLGCQEDTIPNPALKSEDGTYLPAHMLRDETMERAGRL